MGRVGYTYPMQGISPAVRATIPIKSTARSGPGINSRIGDPKMLVERRDSPIDLFPRNNQGRRNHKVRDPGLNRNPLTKHLRGNLIDQQRLTRNLLLIRIEGLLRLPILDQINPPEEPLPANIPHAR